VLSAAAPFVALAWLLWPVAGPRVPSHGALSGANVLLLTIDTLRADRVGAYGGTGGLTATLDRLAARGIRFARAYSHAPITLVAHASILTGTVPPHHGVRNNGAFRLGNQPKTLAEQLKHAGYRTGAFVGAFVLDARFGLDRGFDTYDDRYQDDSRAATATFYFAERRADRVLRAALDWIEAPDSQSQPWFTWIHLFDPHAPYHAPPSFARGRTPYDAEVAWTDSALGAAFDELNQRGQLARTLIVVTADHGESLGDHGETTHGLFAYESTLRVPMILAHPKLPPRAIDQPVAHVDIVPTILDLLGIEPWPDLDGRSLLPIFGSARGKPSYIYFETLDANLTRGWAPLIGVVSEQWKYVELPIAELYDLSRDPNELANIASREPQRVRELQSRLREWQESTATRATRRVVGRDEAERLQALGYVTGSAPAGRQFTSADDPKRLVAPNESFNTALEEFSNHRPEPALDRLQNLLKDRPDFLAARLSAATILVSLGRALQAVRLLRDAPAVQARSPAWMTKTGQALAAAGDLPAARDMLTAAARAAPGDPEPLNELGVVLVRLGRHDEARHAFEQLLHADPTAAGTWYNLGLLEMASRNPVAAAKAFRRVVSIEPRHASAWQGLGAVLVSTEPAAAADAWRHAVELDTRDFDTLFNLGMLLADSQRPSDATPYLQRFLDEAPRERYAADLPRVRSTLARIARVSLQ
jgi:arylsulfatase A-like enzyme/Flp pilus assembly protein TadD